MNSAQEVQNKIYREMSAKKKMEITLSFYRSGKILNNLKNGSDIRTRKSNKNR